jgi:hypothetical protein
LKGHNKQNRKYTTGSLEVTVYNLKNPKKEVKKEKKRRIPPIAVIKFTYKKKSSHQIIQEY